jgi:glycosyltransferase involved in cell wall biosynthesis
MADGLEEIMSLRSRTVSKAGNDGHGEGIRDVVSPKSDQPLSALSFVIAANGFAEGPAQALRDYLVEKRAGRVITILHPLAPEGGPVHLIDRYEGGARVSSKRVWLPSKPPFTYPLDLFVPPWPAAVDVWFGFNPTTCLRGLAAKKVGRAGKVVYWCVDYVEDRFGKGVLTRAYEWLEGICCRLADARVELSSAAAQARDQRHAGRRLAPTRIVPMGAWTQRTPKTSADAWQKRRVVYLGHLVPRQGVGTMIDAIALLNRRGFRVTADIIGRGPEEAALRGKVERDGLAEIVRFRGFIEDHRRVEAILAECSVGVAPYLTEVASFTQFADPGKLKAYLGAGLPIVLTRVPPIATELEQSGAAYIVESSAESVARGIEVVLSSGVDWQRRRDAALTLTQRYDWEVILGDALRRLGLTA